MGKKLTPETIEEMRALVLAGETTRDVARRYGVDCSSVSRAVRGVTWGGKTPSPRMRLLRAMERQNALLEETNTLLRELIAKL